MGPVFYVVAILGCGDGDAPCAPARLLPARYASAAACQAQLPQRLAENTDVPFPTVMADCRLNGATVAKADGRGKVNG